jgi:hypothetical protein
MPLLGGPSALQQGLNRVLPHNNWTFTEHSGPWGLTGDIEDSNLEEVRRLSDRYRSPER